MQLKNKIEREKFLENYREWELWKEVPELELKFYRFILPNGTVIIATEYACIKLTSFEGHKCCYGKAVAVIYHLLLSDGDKFKNTCYVGDYKFYNPSGDRKSTIIKYLTDTKPEV